MAETAPDGRAVPDRLTAGPPIQLPPFAGVCVASAMFAQAVLLTVLSNQYGYHRDELYFRMLPAGWGYVDQPPLAPLLARQLAQLADAAWALRLPATAAAALSVLAVALITREVGGGRSAQALCAWGYAFATLPLVMGHALLTSTLDLAVWPAIVLFIMRAQLRNEPRWWVAAGLVAGLSTYNKLLVPLLLAALAAGVLVTGPRRLLRSTWVWAAIVVMLVSSLPNLIYQARHGWPQLDMGAAMAAENAGEIRTLMWPFLLVLLGPLLVPIWWAGWRWLRHEPALAAVRFVATAFPALLIAVFAMGTQVYYPFGLLAVLFAVGCLPARMWMKRGHRLLVTAAVSLNAVMSVLLALPVIPVRSLGDTPVPVINQIARDTVGWPSYVRQIAGAYRLLDTTERSRAVIVTTNYGEAGAVDRYGDSYGLPPVFSGHNALADAQPPASADVVVFVGFQLGSIQDLFSRCDVVDRLDNGVGVDNEEQGAPIAICRGPAGGWAQAWPKFGHLD